MQNVVPEAILGAITGTIIALFIGVAIGNPVLAGAGTLPGVLLFIPRS